MIHEFDQVLRKCIRDSWEGSEAKRDDWSKVFASEFFKRWFRGAGAGSSSFFLFSKNLSVTNLAHAELLALIRTNCSPRASSTPLVFFSVEDFMAMMRGMSRAFSRDKTICEEELTKLLAPILPGLVVVQPFFGSVVVYLPHGLALDLAKVCGLSGYIHSCGPLIFSRNIDKALEEDLRTAVSEFVADLNWPRPPRSRCGSANRVRARGLY